MDMTDLKIGDVIERRVLRYPQKAICLEYRKVLYIDKRFIWTSNAYTTKKEAQMDNNIASQFCDTKQLYGSDIISKVEEKPKYDRVIQCPRCQYHFNQAVIDKGVFKAEIKPQEKPKKKLEKIENPIYGTFLEKYMVIKINEIIDHLNGGNL